MAFGVDDALIIAACVSAAATIASQAMKPGQKAPAPQMGGGGKQPFELPKNIFGEEQGGAQQAPAGLAQALGSPGQPPQFGPQGGGGAYDQTMRDQKLRSLLGR